MKPQVIICSRVERKNISSTEDFEVLNTESATLVQELNESNAGKFATQQLDIVADIEQEKAAELQTIPQLWRLTTSEDKVIEWGDTTYKSKCKSCTRTGDATRISFKRVTPNIDL